jgi:hypothetical protein
MYVLCFPWPKVASELEAKFYCVRTTDNSLGAPSVWSYKHKMICYAEDYPYIHTSLPPGNKNGDNVKK